MNNDPLPIDAWLAMVSTLINPMLPGELRAPLSRLKPQLVDSFSPRVFTPLSARCIAEAERFGPCPDWGVFSKVLHQYARDFIPRAAQARLGAPADEPFIPPTQEVIDRVTEKLRLAKAEIRDHKRNNPLATNEPPKANYLTDEQLAEAYAARGLINPRALIGVARRREAEARGAGGVGL